MHWMWNTICSVWNSTNNISGYAYLNSLKCHYTKQALEKQFENPRTYVPFAIADIIKSKAKNNESKRRGGKRKLQKRKRSSGWRKLLIWCLLYFQTMNYLFHAILTNNTIWKHDLFNSSCKHFGFRRCYCNLTFFSLFFAI